MPCAPIARRLALSTLLLAVACSSPGNGPQAGAPPVEVSAQAPESPPTTELDAAFLVGYWGPVPELQAIDERVAAYEEEGRELHEAMLMSYQARLRFHADGTCDMGVSVRGEFQAFSGTYTVQALDPEHLSLSIRVEDEDLGTHGLTRAGEVLRVESDDHGLHGSWMRLQGGAAAGVEDERSRQEGIAHLEWREQRPEALAAIESGMAARERSLRTLVESVRVICESEELTGDLDRDHPVEGQQVVDLMNAARMQESLLSMLPYPEAPSSPVLAEHAQRSAPVEDRWLAGTWRLDLDALPWDQAFPHMPEDMRPALREMLGSFRATYRVRGDFEQHMGATGSEEQAAGYFKLVPGSGSWTWMSRLELRGGADVGLESEQHLVVPLYRVGDTLWMGMGPEGVLPFLRTDD